MNPISVIVPVAERPESLAWVYSHFSVPLKEAGLDFEFVFAIAHDRIEMAESLKPLAASGEPIRVLELGPGVGESALLEAAAGATTSPILLTLSPYPRVVPDCLPELVQTVEKGADLATAVRSSEGASLFGRVQRRAFHALLNRFVGGRFQDVASGVRAMRREVLEEVPLYGDFFRFLPYLAERQGFRVVEVSVPQHPQDRPSRIYPAGIYVRRMVDVLGLMFLLRFIQKPLRFFGLVGSGLAAAGALVLLILFFQRIRGEGIADRPVLLLAVLLLVLGIQAFAMGLIGEIIVHLNASERRLYRLRSESERGSGGATGGPPEIHDS
jgi:hypothetical protein